jgi:2,4-dienoyl-CoA reductase [(3E)-enoyl-CoA-producing], peroxisomal
MKNDSNGNNKKSNNKVDDIIFPFAFNCLQGKVALITGGGSGICFEIARQFVIGGCDGIIICGRRELFLQDACTMLQNELIRINKTISPAAAALKPNKYDCKIRYHKCDVRDSQQCIAVIDYIREEFNQLDILVNGAAGNFLAPAATLSPKGFATVMSIDALGTYNMSHAAYPLLSSLSSSKLTQSNSTSTSIIINISATLHYGATWWQCHASAAKAAVDSLTRSLALEWSNSSPSPRGNGTTNTSTTTKLRKSVRVVGIAPGPIANTPGTTKLAPSTTSTISATTTSSQQQQEQEKQDPVQALIQTKIPMGRMGYAYEIGHAAIYLCLAQYITGHTIVVDGGEWMYRDPIVPYEMVTTLSRQIESTSRKQRPTTSITDVSSSSSLSSMVVSNPKSSL